MRAESARIVALSVAASAVAASIFTGELLRSAGVRLALGAPPFFGSWQIRLGLQVLLPMAVGLAVVTLGPGLARRLPWPRLLAAVLATGAAWAVSLALTDGVAGLRAPLLAEGEYLRDVGRVHDVTGFLTHFTSFINTNGGPSPWSTHVAGHPPGFLLLLHGLTVVGLSGVWPAVVLCLLGGCSAPLAVLVTVRQVAGEPCARAAAPFLVVLPAAIWVAVSADAFYLGVSSWGIAALACGAARRGLVGDLLSCTGGLLMGVSLFLSYGLLTLGALAAAVVLVVRRVRPVLLAVLSVIAVGLGFALLGFNWFDGLHQTLIRYRAGAGGYRPYAYFVIADLAVLAVALGPATVAGLTALGRRDRLWILVCPVLIAVAFADLSGDSKAEVERIWLPFTPWLAVATAHLPEPRRWLGAQVAVGVILQVMLHSAW